MVRKIDRDLGAIMRNGSKVTAKLQQSYSNVTAKVQHMKHLSKQAFLTLLVQRQAVVHITAVNVASITQPNL